MELMDALRGRHSTRVYKSDPVEESVVVALCEAAALAPSPYNCQPWHFHVAMGRSRADVAEIMALTTQYLQEYVEALGEEAVERGAQFYANLGEAPVVIAISAPKPADTDERNHTYLSIGAAVENFALAALDVGLGSCTLTAPEWIEDRLEKVFDIGPDREIASLLIVGWPDEVPVTHDHNTDVVTFLGV